MFKSYMDEAISLAREAYERCEVPVGALVVYKNDIIAKNSNRMKEQDEPVAHAEMLVLKEANIALQSSHLDECDIYVSLEPCFMCAAAISFYRVRRLYYGAGDVKSGGIDYFNSKKCHHKPEIYSGFCENEAAALMKDFFKDRR